MSQRDPRPTTQPAEVVDPDEAATPPRNLVDVERERAHRRRQPATPEEGLQAVRRRSSVLSESTAVKVSLGLVAAIGMAMLGLTARVSTQVQQIQDRLLVEERTLRIVAKKVGVEAIDLSPESRDGDH